MRKVIFTAAAVAMLASPAAAEHLYSYGQPPHGLHGYGAAPQYPTAHGYVAAPDGRAIEFGWSNYGRDRPGPRTGLDRPYGGHGVPYRTPPQGWPNPPF
jgi:hypothetical protein